jgi:chromosome partitioning protein
MGHIEHTSHKGHIITIANQQGGVGKPTTAHALITGLSYKGFKTVAVDIDPQSNLTYTMNADENKTGIYELLKGNINTLEAVQNTKQGDIIIGSLMLSGADMEFSDTGREYLLSEALESLKAVYDFIIIDSPPTLGILTINALTAAQDLIIPMGADAYSLQGLSQLNATIKKVRKRCNPALNIAGILITRYNGRTILSQELKDTIENEIAPTVGARVFQSIIRETISIREAQIQQASLFNLDEKTIGATDYLEFIEEYLKGNKL